LCQNDDGVSPSSRNRKNEKWFESETEKSDLSSILQNFFGDFGSNKLECFCSASVFTWLMRVEASLITLTKKMNHLKLFLVASCGNKLECFCAANVLHGLPGLNLG